MKMTIGLLASAMLVIAGSLDGQSLQNGQLGVTRDVALTQAVRQLNARARVRVSAGTTITEGQIIGSSKDGVTVETRPGTSTSIPINTIDGMWTRRRYTLRGAAIGGGIGAFAMGAYGFAFANGMCERPTGCGGDAIGFGLLVAAIGAAEGASVGAAIGALTKKWVRIDPAQ